MKARQAIILDFIKSFMREKQLPPTMREIGDGCGISSTSVVVYNLRKLLDAGLLVEKRPHQPRGIVVAGDECCPYCGRAD